ncbi:formate dehydrogenase accessory sulfurtransferase FdhD [Sinomicrobium sp. M5D2P9]
MKKTSVSFSKIKRFRDGELQEQDDLLAVEEPMEIRLDHGSASARTSKNIAVTMRTPGNDFELALGFLFTEGIIRHPDQVKAVRYCTDQNRAEHPENIVRVYLREDVQVDLQQLQRNFYTTSSCGICGKESIEQIHLLCPVQQPSHFIITPEQVLQLPGKLRGEQSAFKFTGGIHAAALFTDRGELLLLREDVGRHNALDKLIGAAVFGQKQGVNLSACALLLSGRASFELLQKAAMAGIPVVCAVGAPSSLAVETAKRFNISLVGFLREDHYNIYHDTGRILHSMTTS